MHRNYFLSNFFFKYFVLSIVIINGRICSSFVAFSCHLRFDSTVDKKVFTSIYTHVCDG